MAMARNKYQQYREAVERWVLKHNATLNTPVPAGLLEQLLEEGFFEGVGQDYDDTALWDDQKRQDELVEELAKNLEEGQQAQDDRLDQAEEAIKTLHAELEQIQESVETGSWIYNENSAERAGDFTHSTGAYGGTAPVVLVFNPVDRQGRDHTFADVAIDDYLELKNVEGSGFGLYVVKGKQGTELTCEPVKGGGAPKPTIEVEVRIFHAQGDGGGDYLPLTGGDLSGPLNINVNSGVALSVNSNKVKFWSSGAVELGAYTAFKDNELVTKKYTDDAIKTAVENIDIPEVPDVDLSSYATTAYVDDEISKIQIPEVPSPFRQLRFARDKDWNNLRPGEFGLMDKSNNYTAQWSAVSQIYFLGVDTNGNRLIRDENMQGWSSFLGSAVTVLTSSGTRPLLRIAPTGMGLTAWVMLEWDKESDVFYIGWQEPKCAALMTGTNNNLSNGQNFLFHIPDLFF